MHLLKTFILCSTLLYQSVCSSEFDNLFHDSERTYDDLSHTSKETQNETSSTTDEQSGVNSTSEYRNAVVENLGADSQTNESSSDTVQSALTVTSSHSPVSSTDNTTSHKGITLTEIFGNDPNSSSSDSYSASSSASTAQEQDRTSMKYANSASPATASVNDSSSSKEDDELEAVVRGTPSYVESANTTATQPQTIYQKALALINDTYTLSIVIPIAAGIVFASTIILTIATCRCFRRRCRRRRLRKKVLPDSVKNLRPSDRARLLTDSSDDEF